MENYKIWRVTIQIEKWLDVVQTFREWRGHEYFINLNDKAISSKGYIIGFRGA